MRLPALAFATFVMAVSLRADGQEVEFAENIDFSTLTTFTLVSGSVASSAPELNSDVTAKRITEEIRVQLVAKKLTPVEKGDVVVSWALGSAGGRGQRGTPDGRGAAPYAQSTLVIEMKNNSDLVWRGTYRDDEKDVRKVAERLTQHVRTLLDKYPPSK